MSTNGDPAPLLELDGVNTYYGQIHILEDSNLKVGEGELVCLLGGIGNAYGALAGGMLIGVAQEWSTLVINPSMKVAVGFAVLILVLLVRPQGLFGRARSVER